MYACMRTHTHACMYTCTYTHTHTHTHIHTRVHTQTHVCTNHTHTCVCLSFSQSLHFSNIRGPAPLTALAGQHQLSQSASAVGDCRERERGWMQEALSEGVRVIKVCPYCFGHRHRSRLLSAFTGLLMLDPYPVSHLKRILLLRLGERLSSVTGVYDTDVLWCQSSVVDFSDLLYQWRQWSVTDCSDTLVQCGVSKRVTVWVFWHTYTIGSVKCDWFLCQGQCLQPDLWQGQGFLSTSFFSLWLVLVVVYLHSC